MSLAAAPEEFSSAEAFLQRLQELQSQGRESRQQFLAPQSGTASPYPQALLREDVIFPRLLGGFIYRGQSDATWGLVPSIFRQGNLKSLHDGLPEEASWDHPFWFDQFARAEFQLVEAFSWMAQQIGLDTPHAVEKFARLDRVLAQTISDDQKADHIDRVCDLTNPLFAECVQDLAVAQHHGIPTRLLDWTEDPLMAAYFATSQPSSSNGIAIFALSVTDWFYSESDTEITKAISFIRAPRAREMFIQRQKGLFTMPRRALAMQREYGFDFFEYLSNIDDGRHHASKLIKVILCAGEVKKLRQLLHDRDYRFHTVFPSLSSIKNSIQETQQLFGRAEHQFGKWEPGSEFKVVVRDGRFILESNG